MARSFFETIEQRTDFAACLRRRRVPVRYIYAGSGVEIHRRLATQYPAEYDDGRAEHEIHTVAGIAHLGALPTQVCDIGVSNAMHSIRFVAPYRHLIPGLEQFLGIDCSASLLSVAADRMRAAGIRGCDFGVWNIEGGPASVISGWRRPGPVLTCLLGSTLGNVEDPVSVLMNISVSSRVDDLLVIGLFTAPPRSEVGRLIEEYSAPAVRDMAMEPLRAAGLDDSAMDFRVRWEGQSIVGEVKLKRAADPLGVPLGPGTSITCFVSRRHDRDAALDRLRAARWRPVVDETSDRYLVVVARRV
ncbi:hypothetical protein ALI144C_10260 [Actinosynnema sp. ALI-1.44]|uniref:hypothetical protein n=1 Tax=Actinosynnema sp. ALI-1.44 TaxID=1933779 RepID=UPI00097C975E|nr:hypothetical protein [Actinosynnema sp. ALI-1.44]ONI87012.1 hypothetical protein ALI144C_10260 [Actinosynnema sp. ALI-1.44]